MSSADPGADRPSVSRCRNHRQTKTSIKESAMKLPYQGGCLCGNVRYECDAEPDVQYLCHCRACQKGSGSAYHSGLSVRWDNFTLTAGKAAEWTRSSDSGGAVTHAFCAVCGTPLYVYSKARTTHVSVKAGSLDDPSEFNPTMEIWTECEQLWSRKTPIEARHAKGRPPKPQAS